MKNIARRDFIKKSALVGILGSVKPLVHSSEQLFAADKTSDVILPESDEDELLYNGIRLPKEWPPRNIEKSTYKPMPVPYLASPPKVISIDVGRQLFIDNFLIESTNLKREFHKAKKYQGNPILKPETRLETGGDYLPAAVPKDGGVWWDPKDDKFKMWYEAGWLENMAYAISSDGVHWERPRLEIQQGTNRIIPGLKPDSTTVLLDHFTQNEEERFKMFLRPPGGRQPAYVLVSADGIQWSDPVPTGDLGDRSTMFYNPFRKKWIFSIRSTGNVELKPIGRARFYHESSNFFNGVNWNYDSLVFWTGADYLDLPDPAVGDKAQLYNLSAVAYESVMLGLHEILLGPANDECKKMGIPKITELKLSYSRDGFHWDRPDREPFIQATRTEGSWERGYVQSVGGICLVIGDQLRFYYTGFEGDQTKLDPSGRRNGMYAKGSTGIATIRRDGFASMSPYQNKGTLTTRLLIFKGKHLFVNVDCAQGLLRAEVLDKDNKIIEPFSLENCESVSADSTIYKMSWKNSRDLSFVAGNAVRFRFHLENGRIYSFWVSPDESGASYGFIAAGGPGYKGAIDDRGFAAYSLAKTYPLL